MAATSGDPVVGKAGTAGALGKASTRIREDLGCTDPGSCRVDLIIACHNPERPIARAVASVRDGNPQACITLVCHNRSAEDFYSVLRPQDRDAVRYLEHHDGLHSPAGPFNAGMRAARCEFLSIMGSDDRLAPGAVTSWLNLAVKTGANMVIPRLSLGSPRRHVPTPPVRLSRLLRPALADFAADRLAYRSAPLGLINTQFYRANTVDLVEGLPVGEDQALAMSLYSRGRVVYDAAGPCYLIGEDASDRVTLAPRPLQQELAFLPTLTAADAPAGLRNTLRLKERQALAVKTARIHLFGAVHYRARGYAWREEDREALAVAVTELTNFAPGWEGSLSVAEMRLLQACAHPQAPLSELLSASAARRRHGRPSTLLTVRWWKLAGAQSPARLMAASLLSQRITGRSDAWEPEETI